MKLKITLLILIAISIMLGALKVLSIIYISWTWVSYPILIPFGVILIICLICLGLEMFYYDRNTKKKIKADGRAHIGREM